MKKMNLHDVELSRLNGSDRYAHCCCYFDQDDNDKQVTECNHHKELRVEIELCRERFQCILDHSDDVMICNIARAALSETTKDCGHGYIGNDVDRCPYCRADKMKLTLAELEKI